MSLDESGVASSRLNLSNLSDQECANIFNLLQRDYTLRKQDRITLSEQKPNSDTRPPKPPRLKSQEHSENLNTEEIITGSRSLSASLKELVPSPSLNLNPTTRSEPCSTNELKFAPASGHPQSRRNGRLTSIYDEHIPETGTPVSNSRSHLNYNDSEHTRHKHSDSRRAGRFSTIYDNVENETIRPERNRKESGGEETHCYRCGDMLSLIMKRKALCSGCYHWICKICAVWEPESLSYKCSIHSEEEIDSMIGDDTLVSELSIEESPTESSYSTASKETESTHTTSGIDMSVSEISDISRMEITPKDQDTISVSNFFKQPAGKNVLEGLADVSAWLNEKSAVRNNMNEILLEDSKGIEDEPFNALLETETKKFLQSMHSLLKELNVTLKMGRDDEFVEKILLRYQKVITSKLEDLEQTLHIAVDGQSYDTDCIVNHSDIPRILTSILNKLSTEPLPTEIYDLHDNTFNNEEAANYFLAKILNSDCESIDGDEHEKISPNTNYNHTGEMKLPDFQSTENACVDPDLISLSAVSILHEQKTPNHELNNEEDLVSESASRWDAESTDSKDSETTNWIMRGKPNLHMHSLDSISTSSNIFKSDYLSSDSEDEVTITVPDVQESTTTNKREINPKTGYGVINGSEFVNSISKWIMSNLYSSENESFDGSSETEFSDDVMDDQDSLYSDGSDDSNFVEGFYNLEHEHTTSQYDIQSNETIKYERTNMQPIRLKETMNEPLKGGSVDSVMSDDLCVQSAAVKSSIGKIPVFISPLTDITSTCGETVKLKCKIQAEPAASVTWYHSGMKIQNSSTYRLDEFGERDYFLLIFNVKSEYQGEYSVRAVNPAGEAKSTCQLTVTEPSKTDIDNKTNNTRDINKTSVSPARAEKSQIDSVNHLLLQPFLPSELDKFVKSPQTQPPQYLHSRNQMNDLSVTGRIGTGNKNLRISQLETVSSTRDKITSKYQPSMDEQQTEHLPHEVLHSTNTDIHANTTNSSSPVPACEVYEIKPRSDKPHVTSIEIKEEWSLLAENNSQSLTNTDKADMHITTIELGDELPAAVETNQLRFDPSSARPNKSHVTSIVLGEEQQFVEPTNSKTEKTTTDVNSAPLVKISPRKNSSSAVNQESPHFDIQSGSVRERQFSEGNIRSRSQSIKSQMAALSRANPEHDPITLRSELKEEAVPASRSEWSFGNQIQTVRSRRSSLSEELNNPSTSKPTDEKKTTPPTSVVKTTPVKRASLKVTSLKSNVMIDRRPDTSKPSPNFNSPPNDGNQYIKICGRWVKMKSKATGNTIAKQPIKSQPVVESSVKQHREDEKPPSHRSTKSEWSHPNSIGDTMKKFIKDQEGTQTPIAGRSMDII